MNSSQKPLQIRPTWRVSGGIFLPSYQEMKTGVAKGNVPLDYAEESGGAPMRILVADDEGDIRSLIKVSLEDCGYSVVTAQNGKEAWDILNEQQVDLAVLDVMMPVMDGFTLLRRIRERSVLPVILLTARTDEVDKVLGLGLGADDYMSKPFSVAELVARVGAHLRRSTQYLGSGGQPPGRLTYGFLSLDREACCAFRDGIPLELGAKEFKLLLLFMENPERVFTKRQIYQAVWDEDFYYDDNTVMVHMSRLRSKIEEDPHQPLYLKTIRGIGYKLHYTGERQ